MKTCSWIEVVDLGLGDYKKEPILSCCAASVWADWDEKGGVSVREEEGRELGLGETELGGRLGTYGARTLLRPAREDDALANITTNPPARQL